MNDAKKYWVEMADIIMKECIDKEKDKMTNEEKDEKIASTKIQE